MDIYRERKGKKVGSREKNEWKIKTELERKRRKNQERITEKKWRKKKEEIRYKNEGEIKKDVMWKMAKIKKELKRK